MGPEVVNKNKNCVFNGPYAGRDLYITMLEDKEREFVVTHNANIKPVSYFTGREVELQELRQRIEAGRKSVLVSGMGGIGKTHICRKLFEEYLNKHAEDENGPFRHIGYIEFNGDMGSSLQNCLRFKQQDSPDQNQEAAWRELEYLAADGKLLLFVDNVDKPINDDSGLERLKGIPGAIVLTSRQISFGDEFELYRIGFLDVEQCKEIYEKIRFGDSKRKVRPEEVLDLEYIIENLAGRHTITVEFLAHLARTKIWNVKRLREELEQKGFRLTFHKDGELVNIQESYEKLYDLSELTEAEQNILEAFSLFPYILLSPEACSEWLLADAGVSEDDDIMMGLYRKGWLQFDMDEESYALHPVFAEFIFEKCKPKYENHSGMIEACQKSLRILMNMSVLECKKYIPVAESVIEKVDIGRRTEGVEFIIIYVCLLQYIGEYVKAEEWGKVCLQICESTLGEEHPDTVVCYNNLAVIYAQQEEYERAEELCKKCLKIKERTLGKKHEDTAIGYRNLGAVYMHLGEYRKAEELSKKSIEIYERVFGENAPCTIANYSELAEVYVRQGEYGRAEELFEKCLRGSESSLADKPLYMAAIYGGLAQLYLWKDECIKAEDLYKKAIEIYKRMLGETHPQIVAPYNNLAWVYYRKKEYHRSLIFFLKAYKISFFDHRNTRIEYENMERAYLKCNLNGNYDQWLEEKMKE